MSKRDRNSMSNEEIYEEGREGYRRGWKNIPPFSIASISKDRKVQMTAAEIWQSGWKDEKVLAPYRSEFLPQLTVMER